MINLENLKKGRDYIFNNVTDKQFDMNDHRSLCGGNIEFVRLSDCGTVGCSIGWFPFAVNIKLIDFNVFSAGFTSLNFTKYSKRVLNVTSTDAVWDFLFSGRWVKFDNTRLGFIERCDVILEMPDLFNEN